MGNKSVNWLEVLKQMMGSSLIQDKMLVFEKNSFVCALIQCHTVINGIIQDTVTFKKKTAIFLLVVVDEKW